LHGLLRSLGCFANGRTSSDERSPALKRTLGHTLAFAEYLDRVAARVKPTQQLAPLRLAQMPSSSLLFHFVRLAVVIDAGILRNSIAGGKNATGLPLTRQQRNNLVHGRWGVEAHKNKVVNVIGLPTSSAQQSIEYTLEELAEVNEELRKLQSELARLREHWPL